MIRPSRTLLILVAGALLTGPALAEEDGPPGFAVPAVQTSPLPLEMLEITGFHGAIVEPGGSLRIQFVDLSVSARGWPLTIARTYASGVPDTGLGPDWAWSLGLYYGRNPDTGTIFLREADGSESAYARLGGNEYEAVSGRIDSRVWDSSDGGIRRIFSDGSMEVFDASGRLTQRIGVDGAGYVLERDEAGNLIALMHEDGQRLEVAWSGGQVSEIADEAGRTLSFRYEGGRLALMRDGLGRETAQVYDDSGRLAQMTFVDGSALRIEYDVNGRVSRLQGPGTLDSRLDHWGSVGAGRLVQTLVDAMGRTWRLEIMRDAEEPDHLSIVTLDPAGEETVRDIRDGQIDVSHNGTWLGAIIPDSAGGPAALLQPNGMAILPDVAGGGQPAPMAHPDARGLPRLVADPDGSTHWRGYDAVGRVVASAGESGAVERFTYDAGNRLVEYRDDRGDRYTYTYDPADRLLGWEGPGGMFGAYSYNALGQVTRMSGDDLPEQTLSYDVTGQLTSLNDGETDYAVAYDPSGRPTALQSADGRGITMGYDQAGRLETFTDENGLIIELATDGETLVIDSFGRVRGTVTNEDGSLTYLEPIGAQTTVRALENGERLVTMVDENGYGWQERLDPTGALIEAETLGGAPFIVETDEDGRLVRMGDPLQPATVSLDDNGLVTSITDAIGVETVFEHDGNGRLTSVASPYIGIGLRYGEGDAPVAFVTSDGVEIRQQLDERGRPVVYEYEDASGARRREEMAYDDRDRLVRRTGNGLTEEFRYISENVTEMTLSTADSTLTWREEYDPLGRTTTTTLPDGTRSVTTYNESGHAMAYESPIQSVTWEVDANGRILSMTSDGHSYTVGAEDTPWRIDGVEEIEEDGDGVVSIETAVDSNGNAWTTGYNDQDLAVRVENPLGGITRVIRNTLGQVTSVTDPEGRAFYADYDDLGRPFETGVVGGWAEITEWERTWPLATTGSGGNRIYVDTPETGTAVAYANGRETARYSFGPDGRIATGTNASGEVAISYLPDGRVASVTGVFGRTIGYRYDDLGRRSAMVLPDGSEIGFGYSDGNTVIQTGPDGGTTRTQYQHESAAFEIVSPDGAVASLSIGRDDGMAGLGVRSTSGDTEASLTVTRDGGGNVIALDANGVGTRVEHDALGRMAGVIVDDGEAQRWSYDGSGNITAAPDGRPRSYNMAYQQTRLGDDELTWDADGRLTELGQTSLGYDAAGRLIRAESPSGQTVLGYDAFGRLVERQTPQDVEQFLYDGATLIAVYDGSGTRLALFERNAALPRALRLHTADGITTLLPDHLGTPRVSVRDGAVELLEAYGPWGELPPNVPDFARWVGYTGHPQDPNNGLVLMPFRTYMPGIQRFTSPDPLGIDNPVNPYGYANLNPVTLIDPLGGNAGLPGFGPDYFTSQHLNGGYGLPGGNISVPENQALRNEMVRDLRNIANNTDNSPAARRVANETLRVLHNRGVQTNFDPSMNGYGRASGGQGNYRVSINPDLAHTIDTPSGSSMRNYRGPSSVVAHETGHILQRAHQSATGETIGRTLRELDSQLRSDVIRRAAGGYSPNVPLRQSLRESLNYALHTQYGSYSSPSGGRSAPYFGPGNRFGGLTQVSETQIVRMVQQYHPGMRAHEILDEFAQAHRDFARQNRDLIRNNPALRQRLTEMVRRAEQLRDLTAPRPAASAGPHPSPPPASNVARAAGAQPQGVRPARPQAASTTRRPTAGTSPGQANRPRPATNPGSRAPLQPRASGTARLAPPDLRPASSSSSSSAARATGAEPVSRPAANRPPTQRLTRVPNTVDPPSNRPRTQRLTRIPNTIDTPSTRLGTQRLGRVPNTIDPTPPRSRPPATRPPAATNPRRPVGPGARPPRPAGTGPAAPRPRNTARRPPATSPDAPRTTPDRPPRATGPDAPRRPAIDNPRPSSRGGRYPIPDLEADARVRRPPGQLPPPGGRRMSGTPRLPQGASGGGFSHPAVRVGLRTGFIVLDIALTAYETHEYLEGRRSHSDYWSGMALHGAMLVLPHPISTAIMMHQLGKFAGTYLAHKLLEDYRNGDPVARALINWMRRNGWINANDPTFIAVSEAFPPNLTGRRWRVEEGAQTPLLVSVWSGNREEAVLLVFDSSRQPVIDELPVELHPGLTQAMVAGEAVAELSQGRFEVAVRRGNGAPESVLGLDVVRPPTPDAEDLQPAEDESTGTDTPGPPVFRVEVELRETRLEPTDLPWERFDRPDPLIGQDLPDGAETFGDWQWIGDQAVPGGRAHTGGEGLPPVHYVLFAAGTGVVTGDNILQYLRIDPDDPPEQIVIQIWDGNLSARHRLSFGDDVLAIDGRSGHGLVQAGSMPPAGRWLRLRLPVSDIGMDGRTIRGIGFLTDGGRVLFGPTRLSGVEDSSPMMAEAAGRDYGGAPQSDLMVHSFASDYGDLTLSVVTGDGARIPLFAGPTGIGPRRFWWQGDAALLRGATIEAVFTNSDGEVTDLSQPVTGNPALVARILYPPHGAVVRQTVPLFGQAGGSGFDHYIVDYRPAGTGDEAWQVLGRGDAPTVMTDAEVRDRIDRILSRELRGTVYGNLASLQTGSALHSFEFGETPEVIASGWLEWRLRTFDAEGNFRTDSTMVRLGEVATGQERSDIRSPDGNAALVVPPLSLPAGMGTLSIDLDDQVLPPGAPEAQSRIYSIAPGGLQLAAPVEIAIASETGQSIVALGRAGAATRLPTRRDGAFLRALASDTPIGTRFYAADVPPPDVDMAGAGIVAAPWLAEAPEPGLLSAQVLPFADAPLARGPFPLDQPLALVLSFTARDLQQVGLVLRYDNDAVLVPLAGAIAGVDPGLALPGLGLSPADTPQAVFLPLEQLLPAPATQLDSIDLVQIRAAAWRTYVASPVPASRVIVHTVALGTIPAQPYSTRWTAHSNWREGAAGDFREDAIDFEESGWHWITLETLPDGPAWPVMIDNSPPVIAELSPGAGDETGELVVGATLRDTGGGIDRNTIRLSINDTPVPESGIFFEPETGRITAAIGGLPGVRIASGAEVAARLEVSDVFGQPAVSAEWSWRHLNEALSLGNLRQLTVEGGTHPAWLPDGSGFVYVAEAGGQTDLFRMDREGGEPVRLTDTAERESSPAPAPDGSIAFLADGALRLLTGTVGATLADGVVDPAWIGTDSLVAGQENRIVRVGPDGAVETLCTAATGATVLRPRPAGDVVVFTQQIYHRTIWSCDPSTGVVTPLSRNVNAASTRDVDATGSGPDAFIYARDDGAGGLWRRAFGDRRETLVLPGSDASDRRPMLSPDGRTLLFDTDRTGRREVWRLDLQEDVRLGLASAFLQGRAGEAISISFESRAEPDRWRALDESGEAIGEPVSVEEDGAALVWRPASDLPEGELQLEVTLVSGLVARTGMTVDRTPPLIRITRVSDGRPLADIGTIAESDRFLLTVDDGPGGSGTLGLADGTPVATGRPLDPADFPGRVLALVATDATGNTTRLRADLSPGQADGPRIQLASAPLVGTPGEPDSGDRSPYPIVIGLLVLVLLLGGAAYAILRRKST